LLWVMRSFGQHTLLGIIRSDVGRLHQWVQNNPFWSNSRKVDVSVSVSPPKLLKRISPHKQNHMTLFPVSQLNSTNMPQSDKSHIHKLAPFPNRPEDGYMLVWYNIVNGYRVSPVIVPSSFRSWGISII
jgi:hypothetical protein